MLPETLISKATPLSEMDEYQAKDLSLVAEVPTQVFVLCTRASATGRVAVYRDSVRHPVRRHTQLQEEHLNV